MSTDSAPPASESAALSVFDGTKPIGARPRFVQDGFATADPGVVAGKWTLEITARIKAKKMRQ